MHLHLVIANAAQVCWHLATDLLYNKPASGYVRRGLCRRICCKLSTDMTSQKLCSLAHARSLCFRDFSKSNRLTASCHNRLFLQACKWLVATNLILTHPLQLVATLLQVCCNLFASCCKSVKLIACNKSVAFWLRIS